MNAPLGILGLLRIAAPCRVKWSSMLGDDRVRFCGKCQKQVYNLTAMSAEEAARLVIEKEGRLCAQMYQRADGTMLAGNCPMGLQRLRRRLVGLAAGLAAGIAFVIGATLALGTVSRRSGPTRLRHLEPTGRFQACLAWVDRLRNPPPITPPRGMVLGSVAPACPQTPLSPEQLKALIEQLQKGQGSRNRNRSRG